MKTREAAEEGWAADVMPSTSGIVLHSALHAQSHPANSSMYSLMQSFFSSSSYVGFTIILLTLS